MARRLMLVSLGLLLAASAAAQMAPIFEPDDFIDPGQHDKAVFASRLVAGAAANFVNDYRPLHQNAGFLHLANSFYWKNLQFDYKHTELRASDSGPRTVTMCGCQGPIYFPTAPGRDSIPAAPLPSPKETLQFGWYASVPGGPGDPPVALRYRASWSRQSVDTVIRSASTDQVISRLSGREQSLGLDADTYFRIGGHDVFGSLLYARTVRSGTADDRRQQEIAYLSRFPGTSWKGVLLRATVTVGAITGRGAAGLNVVNPAFEAMWHHHASRANFHLVWSPLAMRSGAGGWEMHHQIAIYLDRGYVKLFGKRSS